VLLVLVLVLVHAGSSGCGPGAPAQIEPSEEGGDLLEAKLLAPTHCALP